MLKLLMFGMKIRDARETSIAMPAHHLKTVLIVTSDTE